jgi:nucleotide-binding universal stress UspA family protein
MGDNHRQFETILFTTDFTDASVHAASFAISLARKYNAKLRVLHVVDTTEEAAGFYIPHLSYENLDAELEKTAAAILKKFCEKNLKGIEGYETGVLAGEPYKEILKAAKDADLIVMGTFGKASLERILLGSTTERVMRKATCPVLIVPPAQ